MPTTQLTSNRFASFVPSLVPALARLLLPLLVACDGGSSSSDPVSLEEFSQVVAAQGCAYLVRCRDGVLQNGLMDEEPCGLSLMRTIDDVYDRAAAVADGRLDWDADAVGECLATELGGACGSSFFSIRQRALRCLQPLAAATTDDACVRDFECAGDAYCDHAGSCGGHCRPAQQAGDPCDDTEGDGPCGADLWCDEGGSYVCMPRVGAGDECDFDGDACPRDLQCNLLPGYDHTGTCGAREPAEPQSFGDECYAGAGRGTGDGDPCTAGTACLPELVDTDFVITTCQKRASSGGPCVRLDYDPNRPCPFDEYCAAPADEQQGSCAPRLPMGAACDPRALNPCVAGARCDYTTAACIPAARARIGEPCQLDRDCYSGDCSPDGTCAYPFDCAPEQT